MEGHLRPFYSTWFSTTQLGSICASPSGSKTTVWYSLKSVRVTSAFSGQASMVSMIVSLSKSHSQTLPTPSPGRTDGWTDVRFHYSLFTGCKKCSTLNTPGALLTIRVLLQRVGDQTAVIRTRWQQVWDAIIVIVIITLVSLAVLVSVQLGAVDDCWAVVSRVLVTISITGQERFWSLHRY